MNKLKEMIKRKKEQGFTLIELMIVIAVIGILAIVLVPKVGTIKTQSKTVGIETNIRLVEGYIHSKSSYWASEGSTPEEVAADIYKAFDNSSDKMANPFSAGTGIYNMTPATDVGTDTEANALVINEVDASDDPQPPTETSGIILVSVPADDFTGTSEIIIEGYDNASTPVVIKSVTIAP